MLSKILARDGAQVSATTAEREAADPLLRIAAAADMYHDALGTAAETHLGATRLDKLATLADSLYPHLTQAEGWPVLRNHLALLACAGHNPAAALSEAVAKGGLDDAGDPAAVLDWRIDPTGGHSAGVGPLRWLPAVPDQLGQNPQWGQYLHRRADLVTELADHIRAHRTRMDASHRTRMGQTPHRNGTGAGRRNRRVPCGTPSGARGQPPPRRRQYAARPRTIQRLLQDAAVDAIGRRRPAVARFRQLIDSIDPRIRSDSFWPQLAEHLAQAAPSRPDLAHLVVDAASEHPLPDELPAAALWWRLSGKISHTATLDTPNAKIRPPWIRDLHAVFGSAIAETIAADPAWPALVAAIATADPKRWTPRDLLHLAAEQLADADPDRRSIAAYEYARWITHTVDMVTTADPTAHPHHNLPTPDHAPLTREEEEELAGLDPDHITPDDQLPAPDLGDIDDMQRSVNDTLVDAEPPPSHPGTPGDGEDLGSLQFEDLSPRRVPPPPLPAALLDVATVRTAYQQALDEHDTLARLVATFNGPALTAAMPQIRELRAAAEADQPHWQAVQEVIDQWADADTQYDAAARPDRLGTSTTRQPAQHARRRPARHRLRPSRPAPATHDLAHPLPRRTLLPSAHGRQHRPRRRGRRRPAHHHQRRCRQSNCRRQRRRPTGTAHRAAPVQRPAT